MRDPSEINDAVADGVDGIAGAERRARGGFQLFLSGSACQVIFGAAAGLATTLAAYPAPLPSENVSAISEMAIAGV